MWKILDINIDIKSRLFSILSITACVANAMGFIANALIYGFSIPTILCGVCVVLMMILSSIGFISKQFSACAVLILLITTVFEFPFLYYVYGKSTIVYMVLGIGSVAIFMNKNIRIIYGAFLILWDAFTICFSYFKPSTLENISNEDAVVSTLCSFIIVVCSLFSMVVLLIRQYEWQSDELIAMNENIKFQSMRDPLTKIYNRRYLNEFIDVMVNSHKQDFIVALADLDDFKKINDEYGHLYGDEVLVEFATRAKNLMEGRGMVARYGGEEFMFVFQDNDTKQVRLIMDELRDEFVKYAVKAKGVPFTFSAGVQYYDGTVTAEKLFNCADEKMYQAKEKGKNLVVY